MIRGSPIASRHEEARTALNMDHNTISSSPLGHSQVSIPNAVGGHERALDSIDMALVDDPFEDFDVESGSEKDFLIANLRNDAPQKDVEEFIEVWTPWSLKVSGNIQQWDTTMDQTDFEETVRTARVSEIVFGNQDWQEFKFLQNASVAEIDARIYELILTEQDENGQNPLPSLEYPAPYLILQNKVELFAQSHVFIVNKHAKHTTLQRRDYTRDIYDYARAIGMGRNQAKIEVQRARAAYRRDRDLAGGPRLDESDDESTLGLEIDDAAEYIAAMTNGMQQGHVDPAGAREKLKRLEAKSLHYETPAGKRKRTALDSKSTNNFVLGAERRNSNESNKSSKGSKFRTRRKRKRQNGSGLNQPGGNMNIVPEGQFDFDPSSRPAETKPSTKYSTDATQNLPNAFEEGEGISDSIKEERRAKTFIPNSMGICVMPGEESWDLRRKKKKKKKRKRKLINYPSRADESLDTYAMIEDHLKGIRSTSIPLIKSTEIFDQFRYARGIATEKGKVVPSNETASEDDKGMTLSELLHKNLDKSIEGRRGKRDKAIKATTSGNPILDNVELDSEINYTKAPNDSRKNKVEGSTDAGITEKTSRVPESKCEVIIYTPSKTWLSHVNTKSNAGAKSIDFDSSTSILESTFSENTKDEAFTMSERSLDWDHSGPEFEDIKVGPKVTRSSPSKSESKTPTKSTKTRDSSNSLQTPESNRKNGDIIYKLIQDQIEDVISSDEITSVLKKSTKTPAKSPFFSPPASTKRLIPIPDKKPRQKGGLISCIPFPPLSSSSFGLLQEQLWDDPFRLLVGVTFLNRTMGKHAIPVFFSLMERYPTPTDILEADKEDIISLTHHLGLQSQRADTYKKFAHFWINDPPVKGKRYRVDHYPNPGDGMDIKSGEIIEDDDPRSAWEIGHMTKGRYAIDSWRIFCRDVLRGEAEGWNGEGREDGFQPEWMRVQPRDKELIACLRWMWLKEGFSWDPVTGEKEVADRKLMDAAIAGKITWDDMGGMRIVEEDCADVESEAGTRHISN